MWKKFEGKQIITNNFSSVTQSLGFKEEKIKIILYIITAESISYCMIRSRPNIILVVTVVSRFMVDLKHAYWKVLMWVLGCLKESFDVGARIFK